MHQLAWESCSRQPRALFLKSKINSAAVKVKQQQQPSQMKLFLSEGNPHCVKVLAALQLTGVPCEVQYVSHEGKTAWSALGSNGFLCVPLGTAAHV